MTGLLGIVATGRIWATKIRYLNDLSESEKIWDFVLERVRSRIETGNNKIKESSTKILEIAKRRRLSTDFVASFSEDSDSLSQWRSYCPDGRGVSIGFSTSSLRSQWIADPKGGKSAFVGHNFNKIRYLPHENDGSLDPEIDELLRLCSEMGTFEGFKGPITAEEFFIAWVSLTSTRYKHKAFEQEKEWRLALLKPHKPMPHQRFRPGQSMLIPYVEVELNRDIKYELLPDYFIKEVYVAPSPNEALSREAIQSLFIANDHPEVKVISSVIPYRHW